MSIFLVLALLVTWLVYGTLSRKVSGPTNSYSAVFSDASGLYEGDDVRVAGIRVGRVSRIELVDNHAEVTFQLQSDQTLYQNTVASVAYQNIIGQRYLALTQGDSTDVLPLTPGGVIPVERTIPSFDISYLLHGFEPLFSTLDPNQMDNMTTALINALQGDTGSLLGLITQTSELANAIAGPDQVLGAVIDNLNPVVTNLAEQSANLQTVIAEARQTMGVLNARRDQLVASVGSINQTMTQLSTIVDNIYPDLEELITREPGFAAHLAGDGRERASYMAANLPLLLKGLARITQDGAYANAYGCNINVSLFAFLSRLVPAVVRLASPGNILQNSAMCR